MSNGFSISRCYGALEVRHFSDFVLPSIATALGSHHPDRTTLTEIVYSPKYRSSVDDGCDFHVNKTGDSNVRFVGLLGDTLRPRCRSELYGGRFNDGATIMLTGVISAGSQIQDCVDYDDLSKTVIYSNTRISIVEQSFCSDSDVVFSDLMNFTVKGTQQKVAALTWKDGVSPYIGTLLSSFDHERFYWAINTTSPAYSRLFYSWSSQARNIIGRPYNCRELNRDSGGVIRSSSRGMTMVWVFPGASFVNMRDAYPVLYNRYPSLLVNSGNCSTVYDRLCSLEEQHDLLSRSVENVFHEFMNSASCLALMSFSPPANCSDVISYYNTLLVLPDIDCMGNITDLETYDCADVGSVRASGDTGESRGIRSVSDDINEDQSCVTCGHDPSGTIYPVVVLVVAAVMWFVPGSMMINLYNRGAMLLRWLSILVSNNADDTVLEGDGCHPESHSNIVSCDGDDESSVYGFRYDASENRGMDSNDVTRVDVHCDDAANDNSVVESGALSVLSRGLNVNDVHVADSSVGAHTSGHINSSNEPVSSQQKGDLVIAQLDASSGIVNATTQGEVARALERTNASSDIGEASRSVGVGQSFLAKYTRHKLKKPGTASKSAQITPCTGGDMDVHSSDAVRAANSYPVVLW